MHIDDLMQYCSISSALAMDMGKGKLTELGLSCYLVLLSIDSKTR